MDSTAAKVGVAILGAAGAYITYMYQYKGFMPKKSPLPAYSAFKQFKVRSLFPKDSKERIPATTIWKENGAVIMVVRRMGWLLCREEAQKLLSLKPKLKDAGLESVKFAAVVHENLPGQLESFQRYWNDNDVYIDEDQSFYKALGNRWLGLFAGMLTRQVWKNIDRAKKGGFKGNLKGEGRLLGGVIVMGPGEQGVIAAFTEDVWGDHADLDAVMKAVHSMKAPIKS